MSQVAETVNTSVSAQSAVPTHCVMIPFFGRIDQVAQCLQALLAQANASTVLLLIDDGSSPAAAVSPHLAPLLAKPNVYLIAHPSNCGVAAARNSGLHWCRRNGIDVVIMLDSDCVPEANVIDEHLRLHTLHPDVICIGGRIVGSGEGLWAQLDGATSWIHASEHGETAASQDHEFRPVRHPYHLATTNFSVKLRELPQRDFVFDERLRTGEDCLLIRELRRTHSGDTVYFSGTPAVHHSDRESFADVFRHHFEWGHHQYFIQLGGDISPRCFNPLYRVLFFTAFLPMVPVFALLGTWFNSRAIFATHRQLLYLVPLIYVLWLGKSLAVLDAAVRPYASLRKARQAIDYVGGDAESSDKQNNRSVVLS